MTHVNIQRYDAMFQRCRARGEGAFGAFLMLGDPEIASCEQYLDALVQGGADMIEVGIPFSDPVADGPVIQAAASRALSAGVTVRDCIAMLAAFRLRHPAVPIGVLTYANIVASRGIERFCHELASAGADSLLVADVPCIEAQPYAAAAQAFGIELIMIAATNTPAATVRRIAALGSGYTYCVARAGVTGVDDKLSLNHKELYEELFAAGAAPAILGFGISTPQQVAEAIGSGACGVISGSAIVSMIARRQEPAEVAAFITAMKAATLIERQQHERLGLLR